ncbi:MAG: InlB B-repeat-containing protein [Bacilli bacterium]|nr:InlB B-repeat-containing protein [Bacilli bacterium]
MNEDRRKIIGTIIGIIIFILCIASLSIAYYRWRSPNKNIEVGIHDGGIKYVYSANNNLLTSTTLAPVTNYNNLSNSLLYTDYTATNLTTNDSYKMSAILHINSISNTLKSNSFKWVLLEGNGTTYTTVIDQGTFASAVTGDNNLNLEVYINPTLVKNYRFIMYIDGSVQNRPSSGSIDAELELCDEKVPIIPVNLNNNGADTGQGGTAIIYERYGVGIYKDSAATNQKMTATANGITKPTKIGHTFAGYYDAAQQHHVAEANDCAGNQIIKDTGFINTDNFINTKYTVEATAYACWIVNTYDIVLVDKNGTLTMSKSNPINYDYVDPDADLYIDANKTIKLHGNPNTTSAANAASGTVTINQTTSTTPQGFAGFTSTNYTATTGINTSTAKYGSTSRPTTAWTNPSTKTTPYDRTYFRSLREKSGTVTLTANWNPVAVPSGTITRSTYTCGWTTSPTGTTIEIASGGTYMPAENSPQVIEVYGVCTSNNYQNTTTGTYYTYLKDALEAAASNQTIKALKNIPVDTTDQEKSNPIIASGKTGITIDLDGKQVNIGNTIITNNGTGTLTIKSTTSGGVLSGTGNYVINAGAGAITVTSGTVSGTKTAISSTTGSVTVNGGTVKSTATSGNYDGIYNNGGTGTITVSSGTVTGYRAGIYNNVAAPITISGGTVTGTTQAIYNGGAGTISISSGTITGTTQGILNNSTGSIEITGGTISGNNGIVNKNAGAITINGTNAKVTGNTAIGINGLTGNVTVTKGEVKGATHGISVTTGNVTVNGGTVASTATSGNNDGISKSGAGTISVSSGTVTGARGGIYNSSTGSIEITGGTITGNNGINNTNAGPITINGTGVTVTGIAGVGVIASAGDVTVTKGTVSGTTNGLTSTTGDVTINGGIVKTTATSGNNDGISKSSTGTISVSSGSVTGYRNGIYNASTGTVNITGGTITGNNGVVNNGAGTITVNTTGQSITGTAGVGVAGASGNVTLTAGTIKGSTHGISSTTGNVTINGGVVQTTATSGNNDGISKSGAGGTVSVTAGSITGARSGIYNASTGTVNVTGGTVSGNNGIQNNGAGTITINGNGVAIQGTSGTGIIGQTGSVTVTTGSVTGTTTGISSTTGTVTINGGTISNTVASGTNAGIYKNGGSGTVTVAGGTVSGYYGIYNNAAGPISITGGTITGTGMNGIYNKTTGTITVTGGTVSGLSHGIHMVGAGSLTLGENSGTPSTTSPLIKTTGTSNMNGVYVQNAGATFNFYDGKITSASGTGTSIKLPNATFIIGVPDGYDIIKSTTSGTETAILGAATNYQNMTTNKKYMYLYRAMSEVATGQTIKVLENSSETSAATLAADKTVTLDLNGKTITMTGVNITNNGTLTISSSQTGGTINSNVNNVINTGANNLTVSGGTITGPQNVINATTANITISGGNITSTATTGNYEGIYKNGATGTITVSSGSVTGYRSGIYNNGASPINITGGTITGTTQGIFNNSTGTLTISGGTITGTTQGIYNNSTGSISITGGTITGNNGIVNKAAGPITVNGASVKVTGTNGNGITGVTGTITVTNGEVKGSTNGINSTTGTVTVNGGTVTSTATSGTNAAIYKNGATGTVTISSGTVSGYYGIYNNGASPINITGGTITGTGANGVYNKAAGTITVTGGTISGVSHGIHIEAATGVLTLGENGGTPSTTTPLIKTTGTSNTYGVYIKNASGTFNFYDGKITSDSGTGKSIFLPNATYLVTVPDGYDIVKTTSGNTETAVLGAATNYQNMTTNKKYMYLYRALSEVATGQTIKTLANTTETTVATIPTGLTVTLDLNGKTITMTGVNITNNGTLTISSSTSGGAINCSVNNVINTGANNLTVSGGTITGPQTVINSTTANITINGGTITSTAPSGNYDGIYKNGATGTITISSGSVTGYRAGIYNNAASPINISGGTITGTTSGVYNGNAGNITITGGSITGTTQGVYNNSTATVSISNGTITGTTQGIYNNSTGTISVTGGTITGNNGIVNKAAGPITVNGSSAKVTGTNGNGITGVTGAITVTNGEVKGSTNGINSTTGTVTVNGGTVQSTATSGTNGAIYKNGASGTVTISSGTVSGYYGIYNNAAGPISITGGTVTGTTMNGIYNKSSGTITITGGTISGVSHGVHLYAASGTLTMGTNDGGTPSTTSPLIKTTGTSNTYGVYVQNASAIYNFYDGKVTSDSGAGKSIYLPNSTYFVTVPNDYDIVKTTSGSTETAVLGAATNYQNTTTNKKYMYISRALSEASTGHTIKALANVTETTQATIASGKTITIDLNGKTITFTGTNIANNGTLTITSSTSGGVLTGDVNNFINTTTNNVTISGGTVTSTQTVINSTTGNVTINGGNVTSTATSGNYDAIYKNGATGTITVSSGSVTGYRAGIYNNGTSSITISGGTITGTTQAVFNNTTGSVTISGGVINGTTQAINNNSTATISITGGTISGNKGIYNKTTGAVTINGASVQVTGVSGVGIEGITGAITVTNGTVSGSTHGISSTTGTVTINGGTVTSTATTGANGAIYKNGASGDVTISSGTVSGPYGIYNNAAGPIVITGGTITGTVTNGIYNKTTGTVSITGGTISGVSHGIHMVGAGTLTMGTNDGGTPSTTTPLIKTTGTNAINGVYVQNASAVFNFYDGKITSDSGRGTAIKLPNATYTINTPTNYGVATFTSGNTETAILGRLYTITLSAGQGVNQLTASGWTGSPGATLTKSVAQGTQIVMSSISLTVATGFTNQTWARTAGTGNLSDGIFTVGAGTATLTASAEYINYTVTYDQNLFTAQAKTQNGVTISYDANNQYITLNGTTTTNSLSFGQLINMTLTTGHTYGFTLTYVSGSFTSTAASNVFVLDYQKNGANFSDRGTAPMSYVTGPLPTTAASPTTRTIVLDSSRAGANGLYFWFWHSSGDYSTTFTNYRMRVSVTKTGNQTIHYGDHYSLPSNPSKPGFTFAGWYDAINGGNEITASSNMSKTTDHTIYAHWTPNNVTVTLQKDGSTYTSSGMRVALSTSSSSNTNNYSATANSTSGAASFSSAGLQRILAGTTYYIWIGKDSNHKTADDAMVYSGVTVTGATAATATAKYYTMTISLDNTKISVNGTNITNGNTVVVAGGTGTAANNFAHTIVATANTGYQFVSGATIWTYSGTATIGSATTASTTIKAAAAGTLKATATPISVGINTDNKLPSATSCKTAGTDTIYQVYNDGYYLDSAHTKKMTTSANPINVPSATGYNFGGYCKVTTRPCPSGALVISSTGYLQTGNVATTFTTNQTWTAIWTRNFTCAAAKSNTTYQGQSWYTNSNTNNGFCDLSLNATVGASGGNTYNNATTTGTAGVLNYIKSYPNNTSALKTEYDCGLITAVDTNSGTGGTVSGTATYWYTTGKVWNRTAKNSYGLATGSYWYYDGSWAASGNTTTWNSGTPPYLTGTGVKRELIRAMSSTTAYTTGQQNATNTDAAKTVTNTVYSCGNSTNYLVSTVNQFNWHGNTSSSQVYFHRYRWSAGASGRTAESVENDTVAAQTWYFKACGGAHHGNNRLKVWANSSSAAKIYNYESGNTSNFSSGAVITIAGGYTSSTGSNTGTRVYHFEESSRCAKRNTCSVSTNVTIPYMYRPHIKVNMSTSA